MTFRQIGRRMKWKGSTRYFCLSSQRTGTTSVGDFFTHYGYPTCRWGRSAKNKWSAQWMNGNYNAIFKSNDFRSFQVFEDDPWWLPEFYKFLYHKFPDAKFVLLSRDSRSWFKSMISHSGGKTLGNTKRHCKVYRREMEFYNRIDNDPNFKYSEIEIDNLLELQGHEEHYTKLYELRIREILDFFNRNDRSRLFYDQLENPDKWKNLGKFIGVHVKEDLTFHRNKSSKN